MTAPTPAAPEPGTGTRDALAAMLDELWTLAARAEQQMHPMDTRAAYVPADKVLVWVRKFRTALAPEVARIEGEAEQRGREDNAEHAMCYVHGSGALEARLAEEREAALREAADDIQALHPGEVKNSVIWLRDRAARIARSRP